MRLRLLAVVILVVLGMPFAMAAIADDTGKFLYRPDRLGRLFGGRTQLAAAPLLRPGG